jgi:hypothetical protein
MAADERVFVAGVPGSFEKVREAVAAAQRESGRQYRVVVVGDAGGGPDAARRLLDSLLDRWRQETADPRPAGGFDPARDVTIVLDVGDRQIAVRAPSGLEKSSGLDPGTIKRELVDKVFVPRARDGQFDEGLADLVAATERWVKDAADRKRAQEEASRVWRTRTLPRALAGLAGIGAVAGLAGARLLRDRRLAAAKKKLADFKSEVVALSDMLDGQQERHRMLPHTDPDFKTPMQGLTRAAYDDVQAALRRHRERWLGLMDVWERAQERIGKASFFGTADADAAIGMLDAVEARPQLADVAGECRAPLDGLEQAHERSRALAQEIDSGIAATTARLEEFSQRGRSQASFQGPMADVIRSVDLAKRDLEADPVAARGRLEQQAAELDRINARIEACERIDRRSAAAAAQAEELAAKVRSRRAEGWLLAEPGANPDDLVSSSGRETALAAQLLDAGETDAAAGHVERAEKANAEGLALVESIVAAKARVDELLPSCVARLAELEGRRGEAQAALEAVAEAYDDAAWADVADNVAKSDEGIGRVRTLVTEARAAHDPARQHFFRALALVEEAVRQEDWVAGLCAASTDRRSELEGLRASLPQRRQMVRERVEAVLQGLARQRTDRVRANERAREAARLAEEADRGLSVRRPDPRQVAQVLDAADGAAARAEELAAEDERLARQAFADLEEVDTLIRRAAAWYEEGVSPDVQPAVAALEAAKGLLSRQRYEDSLKSSAEAARLAREAYAEATAEAEMRRRRRQAEIRRRQMEDSFARMSRGAGPWVIQLPGGTFSGPDPWRTTSATRPTHPASRTSTSGWSGDTVQGSW